MGHVEKEGMKAGGELVGGKGGSARDGGGWEGKWERGQTSKLHYINV